MGGIGIICCFLGGGLVVGVLIGSVVLRCACWIYNKMAGASGEVRARYQDGVDEDDYDDRRRARRRIKTEEDGELDDQEEEDDDDDERPRLRRQPRLLDGDAPGVPEPTMGKAMGIIAINWVIGMGIGFVLNIATGAGVRGFAGAGAAANPGLQLMVSLVQMVLGFLILSGLLSAMLPTKFGRACGVAALTYVIIIALLAVLVGALIVVGFGFGAAGGWGK